MSGIFGAAAAPEPGAVALIMLRKGEFGTSYCGGCIGDKKDWMCIKAICSKNCHKKIRGVLTPH